MLKYLYVPHSIFNANLNFNMYYVFIRYQVIRHMTPSFVFIFIGAFIPMYVGIWTSFHIEGVDDGVPWKTLGAKFLELANFGVFFKT